MLSRERVCPLWVKSGRSHVHIDKLSLDVGIKDGAQVLCRGKFRHVATPLCAALIKVLCVHATIVLPAEADFSQREWLGCPSSAIPEKAGGVSVSPTTKTE